MPQTISHLTPVPAESEPQDLQPQAIRLEEAVRHIRRLTHHLVAALEYSALPPEAINKAEAACHVAARFTDKFDDVNDIILQQ
ncbi:hypothetical protein G4Y79_05085 [Phototrophicus methaneseepsis]|uniref:Uncharacterized protein n=1 Tax=Phototrophicus methaneseepsis TaxID=2710758 RepID=A0A7S8EB98_9CHLR|nr:hypothetical protein [Phototrophicus methaneseepsis]QPC83754.1 hypothetical protein G4Y79_05085 [Phototrophicus methaneseepsis]